jgi:hypothetical protein
VSLQERRTDGCAAPRRVQNPLSRNANPSGFAPAGRTLWENRTSQFKTLFETPRVEVCLDLGTNAAATE